MQKKAYLILFLVIALAFGAWTASPAKSFGAQFVPEARSSECRSGADLLTGSLATIERVQNRVRQICEFNVRMARLDSDISEFDRHFIEHAIVSNMLEIEALEIALQGVENEEWRSLIQMMLAMHTHDLEMAMAAAERLGLNTSPDLTNVPVYPGTPEYDLGMRHVDLVARFLTPLLNAAGVPNETPTAVLTMTAETSTAVPTLITGSPTFIMTLPADTPVPSPTDVTGTETAIPTDVVGTATIVPTDVTDTATPLPTDATGTATAASTLIATETATAIASPTGMPTLPPGNGAVENFDLLALHILEDIHRMHVETALAAQRLVRNDELRAFAKHAGDAAGLHLLLMSDLKHRLFDNYTPPQPDFERDYQGPRQFEPSGEVE